MLKNSTAEHTEKIHAESAESLDKKHQQVLLSGVLRWVTQALKLLTTRAISGKVIFKFKTFLK